MEGSLGLRSGRRVGEDAREPLPLRATSLVLAAGLAYAAASCDKGGADQATLDAGPPAPSPLAAPIARPEPPKPPDIIVDSANVSVGLQRVPVGEPGLADKVAVFVTGRPAIAGQGVDVVAMRNAKPSHVAAVVSALQRAQASSVNVKTETRSGTTQKLPVSFATTSTAACTTVAWIAKDGAIDVWPQAGGTAKRIIKGVAGPDMTLGSEAVDKQASGCGVPHLIVGADDRFPWGLVFDLATMSMQMPGSRLSSAVLVTSAVPGRKVALEAP